jgi:hypothetical protein
MQSAGKTSENIATHGHVNLWDEWRAGKSIKQMGVSINGIPKCLAYGKSTLI